MRTLPRLAAALTAVALASALGAASPSSARAEAPAGPDALAALSTCVQSSGRLLVLMLIDESGSLKENDPGNQRVTAIKSTLENLAELASARHGGAAPDVEVSLAGFSTGYRGGTGWTKLDEPGMRALLAETDGFATRNTGVDTDFDLAFAGARQALAERVQAVTSRGEAAPCQLLLMLTDGEYSVVPRDTAQERHQFGSTKPYAPDVPLDDEAAARRVVQRGRAEVCRADGIVDQLRNDGAVTVTIALTQQIGGGDQAFLKAVGTGAGPGTTCGRRGGLQTGDFLPVQRLEELLFRFNQIAGELSAGTEAAPGITSLGVCQLRPCASGRRVFTIDPALQRFHLLADLGEPGFELELQAPGKGRKLLVRSATAGRTTLGSAGITYDWPSPQVATIDADLPARTIDWIGQWSVTFIDPSGQHPGAVARSQIYLYGDLFPELATPSTFRLGETAALGVRLVNQKGTPQTPEGLVRSARVDARILLPSSGQAIPVALHSAGAMGLYNGAWEVPSSLDDTSAQVELTLIVQTQSGITLEAVRRTYPVPVKPPVAYPDVGPAELQLVSVTGVEPARGVLTITGGEGSAGCVWFGPASFTALPPDARSVRAEIAGDPADRGHCVQVEPGQQRQIEVRAIPAAAATGRVKGVLPVTLASSEPGSPELERRIPVSFSMARPVDTGKRWRLFALLVVGMGLAPLVLLWLLNYALARFQPTTGLRGAEVPVAVGPGGQVMVRREGAVAPPGRLGTRDFRGNVGGTATRQRRITWKSLVLRARAPWNPFAAPYGVAEVAGRHTTGSEGLDRGRRVLCRGRLPLELGGTWVLALDAAPPEQDGHVQEHLQGTLYLMVNELSGSFESLVDALAQDLGERLGPAARALAEAVAPGAWAPGATAAPAGMPLPAGAGRAHGRAADSDPDLEHRRRRRPDL